MSSIPDYTPIMYRQERFIDVIYRHTISPWLPEVVKTNLKSIMLRTTMLTPTDLGFGPSTYRNLKTVPLYCEIK